MLCVRLWLIAYPGQGYSCFLQILAGGQSSSLPFAHVRISMSRLTTIGIKDSLNSNFICWNLCNLAWSFYVKVLISNCAGGTLSITVKPPYVFPVGVVLIIENEQNKDSWWHHKKQTTEFFLYHSTGKTSCGCPTSKDFDLLWIHLVNLSCFIACQFSFVSCMNIDLHCSTFTCRALWASLQSGWLISLLHIRVRL